MPKNILKVISLLLIGISCLILCIITPNIAEANKVPLPPTVQGFQPLTDITIWPIEIVQGHPYIRGSIGNISGVFLVDTGTPWGILVNTARIKLANLQPSIEGFAGSGQKLKFFISEDRLAPVKIYDQTWHEVRSLTASDFGFIEEAGEVSSLLGLIGADFFKNTQIDFDYNRRVMIIRRLNQANNQPIAPLPEWYAVGKTIATLPYTGTPSFPLIDLNIADIPIKLMLDSGNGGASASSLLINQLLENGSASLFSQLQGKSQYLFSSLKIGDRPVFIEDVTPNPELPATGKQEDPYVVKVGFSLFKQFPIAWNYGNQTITFFAPISDNSQGSGYRTSSKDLAGAGFSTISNIHNKTSC